MDVRNRWLSLTGIDLDLNLELKERRIRLAKKSNESITNPNGTDPLIALRHLWLKYEDKTRAWWIRNGIEVSMEVLAHPASSAGDRKIAIQTITDFVNSKHIRGVGVMPGPRYYYIIPECSAQSIKNVLHWWDSNPNLVWNDLHQEFDALP